MKLALTPGFLTDFHHIASLGATGMEKSEHSVVQGAEDRLHPMSRTLKKISVLNIKIFQSVALRLKLRIVCAFSDSIPYKWNYSCLKKE